MALCWSLTAVWRSVRRCGVVAVSYFLVTFAPLRTLETSCCWLGAEVVGHLGLGHPDFVQQHQFCWGVVAVVADQVRTMAQFFCSTCAPSLLLPDRERVKVI